VTEKVKLTTKVST